MSYIADLHREFFQKRYVNSQVNRPGVVSRNNGAVVYIHVIINNEIVIIQCELWKHDVRQCHCYLQIRFLLRKRSLLGL